MITVIVETKDHEVPLARMLTPLVPALVEGVVKELIVADHGSTDETRRVAEMAGCRIIACRDRSVRPVLEAAGGEWVLWLPAGGVPVAGWQQAVIEHLEGDAAGPAVFRPATDMAQPRIMRWLGLANQRAGNARPPRGWLMRRDRALQAAPGNQTLEDVMRGRSARRLDAQLKLQLRS